MIDLPAAVPLSPRVDFPDDPALPQLSKLFDPEWVCAAYRDDCADDLPLQRIKVHQFSYVPARSALVGYVLEWDPDQYVPPRYFTARLERGSPISTFSYPEDDDLPGLSQAADPEGAVGLVNSHILSIPPRRVRVETVRYRPGNRAVLRHSIGRAKLFARVVRPAVLPAMLQATALMGRSRFVVPRVAGVWQAGGTMWMSEMPGENLRQCIRRGAAPNPEPLLDGLESLWAVKDNDSARPPFNLRHAYRRAKSLLRYASGHSSEVGASLKQATCALDPFVETWQPTCIAHNDFYDDQMLALPDGRIAIVDLEEAGLGDPMLDVGNFLAHLRWSSCFAPDQEAKFSESYHDAFRASAMEKFGWDGLELDLREATCLFRISTNAVRRPRQNWLERLETGLCKVNEILNR